MAKYVFLRKMFGEIQQRRVKINRIEAEVKRMPTYSFLTVEDVCMFFCQNELPVCRATVRHWIRSGVLIGHKRSHKRTAKWYISRREFLRFCERIHEMNDESDRKLNRHFDGYLCTRL